MRLLVTTVGTFALGALLTIGCEPRKKANTGGTTAAATASTTAAPTATPTPTAAPTPTPTPTAAPTPTPTTTAAPAPSWPAGMPTIDPNMVAEWAKGIGLQIPPGAVPNAGGAASDPIDAGLKANAAKNAPGYTPASAIGRATLKQGEHAGMNFTMQKGKCYVVLGASGPGVSQLGLHLLFPAVPPNAAIASDTSNTNAPALGGGGKPLCPPVDSPVRVDTVITNGAGQVGVQVWVK